MINWFPGHMNKTLKQMQSDSKLCDCFVYVLDARCPTSCINPEFLRVVKGKPIIYVLNKVDLIEKADADRLKNQFAVNGNECVNVNATVSGSTKVIISTIKKIFADRIEKNKLAGVNFITRVMILGVPNSGKSTIANNLCNQGRAITGNRAGVTKSKQWIKVDGNIEFMDTPGVLLPNFTDEDSAYNLAFVGSVKDEVLNITDVCMHLVSKLMEYEPGVLEQKYGVESSDVSTSVLLDRIGKKRGCIVRGGEIDYERVAKIILTDFRLGKLGKICLE